MDNYSGYPKINPQNRRLGTRISSIMDKYKDNSLNFNNPNNTSFNYKKLNTQIKKPYQSYNPTPYRNQNYRVPYYNKYNFTHRIIEEEIPNYRNNNTLAYDNIQNNNALLSRYDLIDDFQNTYKKSQLIRSRILNQSNNYDIQNSNRFDTENIIKTPVRKFPPGMVYLENKKKLKKSNSLYKNQNSIRKKYENIEDNGAEEIDYKNLQNNYTMNDIGMRRYGRNRKIPDVKLQKFNENYNIDNFGSKIDNGMNENNKLNENINLLIMSNQELRKDNRIMEEEIKNYRNQTKSFVLQDFNSFNPDLQSIKGFLKSFKDSIYANCKILDGILDTKKINDKNYLKITNLYEKNKFLFTKIENSNRRNAEIQISNEENEQKMNQLEEEKNNLTNELESLKLTYSKLLNQEKNLNLLNESNKKVLQDNEEHIFKLKNTINQLNKEKNILSKNYNNNLFNVNANGIDISLYDNKILELNSDLENLLSKKDELTNHQDNLKKIIFYQTPMTPITNKNKLKQEIDLNKKENLIKQQNLKKKENQIQLLKRCIDQLSLAIKSNNPQQNIKRIGIDKIINNIEKDNKIEDMSEMQNLNMKIKLAYENNTNKNNELNQLQANLNNQVMQKDLLINELEQKLKIQNNNLNKFNNNNINNNKFNNNNFNQINNINQQNLQNYNIINNNNFNQNMNLNQMDLNTPENNNLAEIYGGNLGGSINELSLDENENNLQNIPTNNLNKQNLEMNQEQFNQFDENNFSGNENEAEMGYDHEIGDQNDIKDLDSVSVTGEKNQVVENNLNMYNNNEMLEQYPENDVGYEEEYNLNQGQNFLNEGEEYENQNLELHNNELEQINEKNTNEEFDIENLVNENNNNNGEMQLNNNINNMEYDNKNNNNQIDENEYEMDINNMNDLQNVGNLNNDEQEIDMNNNNIHSLNEEELGQEHYQGNEMEDMNNGEMEYDLNNHEQFNNMDDNIDDNNNGYMEEMQNMDGMEEMHGLDGEEEMQNMEEMENNIEGMENMEGEEEMQMHNMEDMENMEGMEEMQGLDNEGM